MHEAIRTKQRSRQNAPAGGGGAADTPPACVLNAEDRDSVVAISPDGLRCQARSEQAWGGVRGTVGAFGGRVYYEATVSDEGLCRWVGAKGWAGWEGRPQLLGKEHVWRQACAEARRPMLHHIFPQGMLCLLPELHPCVLFVFALQGGLVHPGRQPGPGH